MQSLAYSLKKPPDKTYKNLNSNLFVSYNRVSWNFNTGTWAFSLKHKYIQF